MRIYWLVVQFIFSQSLLWEEPIVLSKLLFNFFALKMIEKKKILLYTVWTALQVTDWVGATLATNAQRSKVHDPCPNASHETILLTAGLAATPSGNMIR